MIMGKPVSDVVPDILVHLAGIRRTKMKNFISTNFMVPNFNNFVLNFVIVSWLVD